MSKDKENFDEKLRKFDDLSGISVRQMNIGLWLSENRALMTRLLTIFLIVISAFFYIYSTYAYIIYFMSEPIDNQLEHQVMSPRNVVTPMTVGLATAFRSGNYYDLSVALLNQNDNFWANFDYCFYQGSREIKCGQDFILPSQEKQLIELGVDISSGEGIIFKIEDIFWSRINRREIPNWEQFYKERIKFKFSDVNFFSATKSGLSENLKLNSLEFTLLNDTPYSYYQVDFDILFYSNTRLIGVQKYFGENIKTNEEREVKLSWPGDLSSVNQVKILPHVNIIRDSVYLKYQDTLN